MKYLLNVSTLKYDPELCTGCRYCSEVCPQGVFEMSSKKARITDLDLCIECGACEKNCDTGAIRVKAGVGCSSAYLYGMLTGKEVSCGCDSEGNSTCC